MMKDIFRSYQIILHLLTEKLNINKKYFNNIYIIKSILILGFILFLSQLLFWELFMIRV